MVIMSLPTPTATRIYSGPSVVEVEVPGGSSLQSPTKLIRPLLSLLPIFGSTPPTPTQHTRCSPRLSVSPPRSSLKAMEALVAHLSRHSSSLCYHPTSLQNRPTPLSFRYSNWPTLYQVFPSKTRPPLSVIGGSFILYLPVTGKLESLTRFHPGCCPKMSFKQTNPKSLLDNFSRYLDSRTCEPFTCRYNRFWIQRIFLVVGSLRADRYLV